MKIDWLARLKNPTTLAALIAATLAFIYQVCGLVGIVAPISEDMLTEAVGIIINLLVALGVLVNPTTEGLSD